MELLSIVWHWHFLWSVHGGRLLWRISWYVLPLVAFAITFLKFFLSERRAWRSERMLPRERMAPERYEGTDLPPYPVDLITEMDVPHGKLDEAGVPYNAATARHSACYQPTTIAQYGLTQWNAYLETGEDKFRRAFMAQACWLVEHETHFENDASGWPLSFPVPDFYAQGLWLSCLTQGNAISVLVRAYQLTGEEVFLTVAHRAVRTFELDVANGGVSVSIGENGVFFEEVAVYPAAHILNGYLFGLFGLYDYIAVTHDGQIEALIERSLDTLHALLDEFDLGYWSKYDLLKRHLATHYYHDLHILQFEALARYSGCQHCAALARRWHRYQYSRSCQLIFFMVSRVARYRRGIKRFIFGVPVRTSNSSLNRLVKTPEMSSKKV